MADALPAVRHWRIHLGAHKTATTHLQETLAIIRPMLAESGVDAIPNAAIRDEWPRHLGRRNWRTWVAGRPMEGELARAFAPFRLGPDVVVLSEENFLGELDTPLDTPIYPGLSRRLRILGSLGSRAELSFFLGIRQMDAFLASAYAESLRHFAPRHDFAALAPGLAARPPRWTDIIARIRRAAPRANLTVWRYEDYRPHGRDILARLCGIDPGPLPSLARPRQTMTPSAEAVLKVSRLDPGLPREERIAEAARIYDAGPAGPDMPPFRPFAESADRFRTAYEADLAELSRAGILCRFPRTSIPAGAAPRKPADSG